MYLLANLKEAKAAATRWKDHSNLDRPHSALGDQTHAEFGKAVGIAETLETLTKVKQAAARNRKEMALLS